MRNLVSRFFANEEGVTSIEYGVIAVLVALAILPAVQHVGSNLNGELKKLAKAL